MTSSLLILADRGAVKVYEVMHHGGRGPAPMLLSSWQIDAAHGRYADKVTDQAGGFPTGGTSGRGNSVAEHMSIESEEQARILREIAAGIAKLVTQYRPDSWSFAASAEINGAILDDMPVDIRRRLGRNIAKDLVKVPPAELLEHFK